MMSAHSTTLQYKRAKHILQLRGSYEAMTLQAAARQYPANSSVCLPPCLLPLVRPRVAAGWSECWLRSVVAALSQLLPDKQALMLIEH